MVIVRRSNYYGLTFTQMTIPTPHTELREAYINAHRHDWTMHQEADWWLARLQEETEKAREEKREEIREAINKYVDWSNTESDIEEIKADVLNLPCLLSPNSESK